jgi:hypothetical protein
MITGICQSRRLADPGDHETGAAVLGWQSPRCANAREQAHPSRRSREGAREKVRARRCAREGAREKVRASAKPMPTLARTRRPGAARVPGQPGCAAGDAIRPMAARQRRSPEIARRSSRRRYRGLPRTKARDLERGTTSTPPPSCIAPFRGLSELECASTYSVSGRGYSPVGPLGSLRAGQWPTYQAQAAALALRGRPRGRLSAMIVPSRSSSPPQTPTARRAAARHRGRRAARGSGGRASWHAAGPPAFRQRTAAGRCGTAAQRWRPATCRGLLPPAAGPR